MADVENLRDSIDYAVGFSKFIAINDAVNEEIPLAMVHVRNEAQFEEAQKALRSAIVIGDKRTEDKSDAF